MFLFGHFRKKIWDQNGPYINMFQANLRKVSCISVVEFSAYTSLWRCLEYLRHIIPSWQTSRARNFGQCPGPGTYANVQGQVLWSISRARYFGQCSELGTLANVQDQKHWPISRTRFFRQCPGPGTLVNVQSQVLWPMSRTRNFGQCSGPETLANI